MKSKNAFDEAKIPVKVALLTNMVPPYRLPLYEALQKKVRSLKIFISTPMEPNRSWKVNWGLLDVKVQKTITRRYISSHPSGFREVLYRHYPISTYTDLVNMRPQIIISCEMGFRSLAACVYSQIHAKSKFLLWLTISERTELNRSTIQKRIRKFLLDRSDAIIVNGKSGEKYILKNFSPHSEIFVLPTVTDLDPFLKMEKLGKKDKKKIKLIYVGRIVALKGITHFEKALSYWAVDHPEYQIIFRLIGEGPEKEQVLQFQFPENVQIEYRGMIPYEDIHNEYNWADWSVLPTLADEWGLVVNESLASGVPVLGSLYSQAVTELIVPGLNGFSFFPDELLSVKNALNQAFLMEDLQYDEMSKNARKSIIQLTPDSISLSLVNVIQAI